MVKKYAKESEKFNQNKLAIDKAHDKITKKLFLRKDEVVKLIRKVLKIKIKPEDIEVSQNSFVTTELKYREADIVYKIKGRNIIILIEHQTRVDYRMAYRILNYQLEIMRANEKEKPKKDDTECLVIPIVLYTGKEKWSAKTYIRELQEKIYEEEKIEKGRVGLLGYYLLVDIHNYTKEELLKEKSLLSKIMILEKERNTESLIETVYEINRKTKEKDKQVLYDAMYLLIEEKFGTKVAEEIIRKFIREGSDNMLAMQQMVREENRRLIRQGERQGRILGEKQGKIIAVEQIAKKMLKIGTEDSVIKNVTGITEKQLKEIKEKL